MKRLTWLLVVIIVIQACNNSAQTNTGNDTIQAVKEKTVRPEEQKLLGAWVSPKPARIGQVEGFNLKNDSVVEAINTPTLDYKKWWSNGDQLIFTIKSVGNMPSIEVNDTLVVLAVNNDSLVTSPIGNKNVKTVYRKQNTLNVPLTEIKWTLAKMDGAAVRDSAFIQFDTVGTKFTGYGGCNFIHGNYRIGAASLRIEHLSSTKKMCSPDIDKVERKLFAYIQSTNNYFIVGDELQLREGARTLAVFKATK